MLKIKDLETGYYKKQVLFGPTLEVRDGEIVALIGPNGAGKSTVLKAVFGLLPIWKGQIFFEDILVNEYSPEQNVSRGITFAPQGNRIFKEITVMENLEVGGFRLPRKELKMRIHEVFQLFPILEKRSSQNAGKLSGGERQMLSIARALIPKPKLLMLDEPSLGLSPKLVSTVLNKVSEISHETGVSIIIVEQKVREVLEICHRVYSVKLGKVAFSGDPKELKENKDLVKRLFL